MNKTIIHCYNFGSLLQSIFIQIIEDFSVQ